MKLKDIYELAVKMGIKNDPRDKKVIEERLKDLAKEYKDMSPEKKAAFDKERLKNPYGDTRILYGSPNKKIKKILAGIDVSVGEILLANELNKGSGKKIDMVLSHHPDGRGLIGLPAVMDVQVDIFEKHGVPVNVMEKLMEERVGVVSRGIAGVNHYRDADAARLLDIAYACFHTVADNQVHDFLERYFKKEKPKYVGDVIDSLLKLPEYKEANKMGMGPHIVVGKEKSRAGKVVSVMTGGTSGPKETFMKLAQAGVGTVVEMHTPEEHLKIARKYHINVVIAGHMASDSLGLNLILDKVEKKGVEIESCSGFIRVKR